MSTSLYYVSEIQTDLNYIATVSTTPATALKRLLSILLWGPDPKYICLQMKEISTFQKKKATTLWKEILLYSTTNVQNPEAPRCSQEPPFEMPGFNSTCYLCTTTSSFCPELMKLNDWPGSILETAISLGFTGNPIVAKQNNTRNCKQNPSLVFMHSRG